MLRTAGAMATAAAVWLVAGCTPVGLGPRVEAPASVGDTLLTACDRGDAYACLKLGEEHESGAREGADLGLAALFHARACRGGLEFSCLHLAEIEFDIGPDRTNLDAILTSLQTTCGGGAVAACERAVAVCQKLDHEVLPEIRERCLQMGNSFRAREDLSTAASFYRPACSRVFGSECLELAHMYRQGKGVNQDPARAAAIYSDVCTEGDLDACFHLGRALVRGDGVTVDVGIAGTVFDEACRGGHGLSCHEYAALERSTGAPDARVTQLHLLGCERGATAACVEAGQAYIDGRGVDADPLEASRLLRRACTDGEATGCMRLAELLAASEATRSRADKFRDRACELGLKSACDARQSE